MKNYKLLFFVIALFINFLLNAQVSTSIINQKTFGGNNSEFSTTGTILTNGDYVIGGYSFSGISGDKLESNNGESDFWILNFNSGLINSWQKNIGGDSSDVLLKIISANDGGFLCGGMSSSSISGNKTAPKIGRFDFWLIKFDAAGNILWQNSYGGSDIDALVDIVELSNGDIILGGRSSSPISGTKSENSRGGSDYWIVKIDSNGIVLWDKTIGGNQTEILTNLQIDVFENIYLSGTSNSPISGEKTENNFGSNDVWIVKLDASGNILWDKTLGGSSLDDNGFIIQKDGFLFSISQSFSDISGTKTENSKGQSDYWITKLDANGNIIWDKTIGSDWYDIPRSITATSDGQLLLSGHSWSGVSGDKTEATNGLYDFWLVSIDTSGNILWQKTIGGADWEQLSVTLEISDNHYLLVGDSKSNISGDKTENSRGQEDYWIVEITSTVGIEEINSDIFSVYPNPVSESINITSNSNKNEKNHISIFDITGKLIYSSVFYGNNTTIDLSDVSNGLLLLMIENETEQNTFKIIKQ